MHELSIAVSLHEQIKRHTPADTVVRTARLRIGPMQAIEPDSLRMGWEATWQQDGLTSPTSPPAPTPELVLELLPWRLTCPECGRSWESPELYVVCQCGCATPNPEGGAELQLVSITVDPKS